VRYIAKWNGAAMNGTTESSKIILEISSSTHISYISLYAGQTPIIHSQKHIIYRAFKSTRTYGLLYLILHSAIINKIALRCLCQTIILSDSNTSSLSGLPPEMLSRRAFNLTISALKETSLALAFLSALLRASRLCLASLALISSLVAGKTTFSTFFTRLLTSTGKPKTAFFPTKTPSKQKTKTHQL
jgi:hypothetical protein